MPRGRLSHNGMWRDTKAHVSFPRILFILHSDINMRLYFEVTSHPVIQAASSLNTELVLDMNHKPNWLDFSFSPSFNLLAFMKNAGAMIWRPEILQLIIEARQNTGGYSLSFSKLHCLSDLEEVSGSALEDARHCQFTLKCWGVSREISLSLVPTWSALHRDGTGCQSMQCLLFKSTTIHAPLKLNPKE